MGGAVNDDTIYHDLGRDVERVDICSLNQVESSDESFSEDDAAALIEFVWDFCEESCEAANASIPQKQEPVAHLAVIIVTWNE